MKAILVDNISKKFMLRHQRPRYLAEGLKRLLLPSVREEFWAVKNVSFTVDKGEALGIIGHNGAGKSTILKILTRIMKPTTGRLAVRGRVSALIEVGAGFHMEMTGRENIFLNGSILGMKRAEIARKLDAIIAFAELEKFIDTPVKRYSSGMYARLGFAVAAHVDPDVLVVDEVLSVGDARFQDRCARYMSSLRSSGVTIVFVTHNLSAVSAICDRVIVLSHGQIIAEAEPKDAIAAYRESMAREWELDQLEREVRPPAAEESPFTITSVKLENSPTWEAVSGEPMRLIVEYAAKDRLDSPEIGFKLFNPNGVELARPSTVDYGLSYEVSEGKGALSFDVAELPLLPGKYLIDVFAFDRTGLRPYDEHNHIYELTVLPGDSGYKVGVRYGLIALPGVWACEAPSQDGGQDVESKCRNTNVQQG